MNRFLRNNAVLRVIALVLAVVLWAAVSTQGAMQTDTGTSVPANFPYAVHVQVDGNMVVTAIDNPTAVVVVNQDLSNVTALPAQMLNVAVVADARGLGPGKHVLRLSAMGMPSVNYTIQPSTVTVVLAAKETRTADVRVKVEDRPAPGYLVGAASADAESVTVSGIKDAVDKVAYVEAKVSVQGATATVTRVVQLQPVNREGLPVPNVTVSPDTAAVTVPVQPPAATARLVPQLTGTPAPGFAVAGVEIEPTLVHIDGVPAGVAAPTTVSVPVDVTGFRTSRQVEVQLPLPAGAAALQPDTVVVTVNIEPAASKTFADMPIQVMGASSGERVTLAGAETISLTVAGPSSVIGSMQPRDITVYVDASQLKPGDTSAPLHVIVPNWVQVDQMSQRDVAVRVEAAGTH